MWNCSRGAQGFSVGLRCFVGFWFLAFRFCLVVMFLYVLGLGLQDLVLVKLCGFGVVEV